MRPIEQKMAWQRAVMVEAERWLEENGSQLRLENAYFPHRMAVMDRFVQWARCRREKQLLKHGHLLIRTPHRFRRPR